MALKVASEAKAGRAALSGWSAVDEIAGAGLFLALPGSLFFSVA